MYAEKPSSSSHDLKRQQDEEACRNNPELVASFFECIASKRPGAVYALIMRGPVCANTPNSSTHETPLIAAVCADDATMVRNLVSLGADVNCYGVYNKVERTPLQLAASQGKIDIVKILVESGADDSLVASDGAVAVRLAEENGHQDVVDFLPARRVGAWERWKASHGKEMRQLRRIGEKLG